MTHDEMRGGRVEEEDKGEEERSGFKRDGRHDALRSDLRFIVLNAF